MAKNYKVYYIQHSTFLIELEDKYLLFDYFNNEVIADTVVMHGVLPPMDFSKKLYVFASHSHKDHYGLFILDLAKQFEDVQYILSKDIRIGANYLLRNGYSLDIKKKIKFVSPDHKYKFDDVTVETLRSNDAGVAFVVSANDMLFYHSGDLNWWNTEGRGELYGEQYGREYKRALRHIKNRYFDAAFVVLDPRLGEDGYYLGLDYFVKNVEARNIFPMHLWGQYQWIERFKNRPDIANLRDRIIEMNQENMLFEIED